MAPRRSAGIVLYRHHGDAIEVLLGHMGGPYYAGKDDGAWSIPKGEYDDAERPWDAARREFAEELGSPVPDGAPADLGEVRQRNRKIVTAFAVEGDFDTQTLVSNTFELEWPPRSGRRQEFPETDRAEWFALDEARGKVVSGQAELFDRLAEHLDGVRPDR